MSLSNDLQNINHEISLQEAIAMTSRFRTNMESMLKPEFSGIGILPLCETFEKSIFEDLALQSGCVAIRSYLGMDANNLVKLLFVGVDDNNNDILVSGNVETGYIFEYGQRCPPICVASPLNPQI
jgi:hypothetical protein